LPSLNSIILKTNNGTWEAMRLNTVGTSINTSLYISGTTTINNATTCLSSLNVSGTTVISNNVGIEVNPNCRLYITNTGNNVNSFAIRISSGGGTDGSGYATLIGLVAESGGWYKCAIGHTRTGGWDQGGYCIFMS
jgi:hypothetical protein